jgi:DNA-binding CsgD family transcriptional regulator
VIREEEAVDELALLHMSGREQEILHWVTNGKTNFEIGIILGISPNTVKNHLKRIFLKLEVYSRAQAVAKYNAISQ